jgi:PAS domain S-box-containing protein
VSAGSQLNERAPRILIVDDERHNRQLLEVMLAPEGFQLLAASSGAEAMAIVDRHPPDVILLDVMMPDTDGYGVADQIKSNLATKNIPIIMITALDNREARIQALRAGAEDFLTKPVDRAELCMRVRNLSRLKAYGDYYENQAALLAEQAALLDLAEDAIVVVDLHGRILYWNRGAEAMYGWSCGDALGKSTTDLLKPEFSESYEGIEATLLRDGRWAGEAVHHRRDGSRLVVAGRYALQRDSDGVAARVLTISSDITGRKAREEAFDAAMANASIGMAIVEPGGRWLKVNETICGMLGYTEPELLQMDMQSVTHAEDLESDLQLMRQVLAGGIQTYQLEKRYVHKDGHVVWVLLNASLVRNADASPRYFVKHFQDITARKQVDRMKSEFIATVSHELRTPLTSIRGSLGLIRGGAAGALPEKAARLIEVAYQNSSRLALIVDDILDMEQIDCGKLSLDLKSQVLAPILEQAVEESLGFALRHQTRFVIVGPLPEVTARVDANRILQVLANLLSNAAKFSPAGASVEIGMTVAGAKILIAVTDHGPGIPHSFRDRIFQKFSQADGSDSRNKAGTGLGLTISRALIERMGGAIDYTSDAGIATTFIIELPEVPVMSERAVPDALLT